MKTWVEINERLFQLEKTPEENRDDIWKNEWNSLLLLNVPGTLKRGLYEVTRPKEQGKAEKKGKRKGRQRKNVRSLQRDME